MDIVWLVVKPVFIFIFGYTLIHIMGKHHIGNTTPLDFSLAIVLGSILAEPISSEKISLTLVYGGILVATYALFARLILVNPLRKRLTFKPAMLVANGVIDMKDP
ncbi:MAG: hypothetical protein ACOY46_18225 [Bacillota bacterium]